MKQKYHFDILLTIIIFIISIVLIVGLSFLCTYIKFLAIKQAFPDVTFWQYYILTLFGK